MEDNSKDSKIIEDKNTNIKTEKEADELSVEEFEEEDNAYIDEDENLVDDEEIEEYNKNEKKQNEEEMNFKKEFENFSTDGEIYSLALNEKGIAVIGDGEDTTYIYDINKKELIRKEKINKDSVVSMSFSSDNKYLATASLDGSVNIFDGDEFKLLNTVNGSYSEINWLIWHPKGPVFSFGCSDGSCWVYHAQNIEKNFSFYGHTDTTTCGAWNNDGKYLISASDDCTSKIWDLKNQTLLNTIKGNKYHKAPICSIGISKKKNIFATGSIENELAVANYENGTIVHFMSAGVSKENSIEAIEFCNDDKYIAFASSDATLKILDLSNLQIRIKISTEETGSITKLYSSKLLSHILYFCTDEGYFNVFDYRGTTEIIQKEKLHSDVLYDFVLTKDENYALTCSIDKTINLVKILKL